jgi:hypothetical protein
MHELLRGEDTFYLIIIYWDLKKIIKS